MGEAVHDRPRRDARAVRGRGGEGTAARELEPERTDPRARDAGRRTGRTAGLRGPDPPHVQLVHGWCRRPGARAGERRPTWGPAYHRLYGPIWERRAGLPRPPRRERGRDLGGLRRRPDG